MWSDPNRIEPFLNENAPPPAASPSIVNAKALSKFCIFHLSQNFYSGNSVFIESFIFHLRFTSLKAVIVREWKL